MNEMMEDLELKSLEQHYGSQTYIMVMGAKCTEGVQYIMKNGYSWFITDFICVAKMIPAVKKEEFIAVELQVNGDKAQMVVTDGNDNLLYTQKYTYSSAKRDVKLFFVGNTVMLRREY